MKPKKLNITKAEKKAWIDAMESGEYKFGSGILYNSTTDCYCALGVLSHLHDLPLNGQPQYAALIERFGFSGWSTRLFSEDTLRLSDIYRLNDQCEDFEPIIRVVKNYVEPLD